MAGQRLSQEGHTRRRGPRLSLLAVQSLVCGVVLLLVLLFRLIGGNAWNQLRDVWQNWSTDSGLADAVSDWLEPGGGTPDPTEGGTGGRDVALGEAVSVLTPPAGMTFSPLRVAKTTVSPLKSGKVTSRFGYRTDPIRGGTGFHTGTDVAAAAGQDLYALYDGVVSRAAQDKSYGNYVVIQYAEGLEVWYAHCSVLLCRAGETVHAGETVARVGNTGDSTGNHVHIMAVRNGMHYDPAPLIPESFYA